jgi:hypothetical protein
MFVCCTGITIFWTESKVIGCRHMSWHIGSEHVDPVFILKQVGCQRVSFEWRIYDSYWTQIRE